MRNAMKNMMLKKLLIIPVILSLLFIPAFVLAAENPPAIPLLVYGDIKIDGSSAPVGTIVKAYNGGTVIASQTITTAGKYSLEIPAVNAEIPITYKVGNLIAKQETAADTPSAIIDLSVTTPVVSAPAPAPSGGGTYIPPAPPTVPAAPTTPTSPTPQVLGEKISAAQAQLNQILIDATAVYSENIENILANASSGRDAKKEKNTLDKYIKELTKAIKNLTATDNNRLNFFITYGTVGTKILGAGERAGVLNSYKAAFGKLPKTETEWQDAIKIAGGRWPSERNAAAETKAKASFKKIYGREANMDNQNDNAAVTVMAYGLRPANRNLNSEKAAILAFKYFLKRTPTTAVDWDIVRAIAYSGAKR